MDSIEELLCKESLSDELLCFERLETGDSLLTSESLQDREDSEPSEPCETSKNVGKNEEDTEIQGEETEEDGEKCTVCTRINCPLRENFHGKDRETRFFIINGRLFHDWDYDYSKVDFSKRSGSVPIICRKHGIFLQKPKKHLSGDGCFDCRKKKMNAERFIRKAQKIHRNRYEYNFTYYRNKREKVAIFCKAHNGCFFQTPKTHLSGSGCLRCYGRKSEMG